MQGLLLGKGCHHETALPALISLLRGLVINPARFLVSSVIMVFPFLPVWWTSLHRIAQSSSLFFSWWPYSNGPHDSEVQFLIGGAPYGVPSLGGSLITPVTWALCCPNTWENAVKWCKENLLPLSSIVLSPRDWPTVCKIKAKQWQWKEDRQEKDTEDSSNIAFWDATVKYSFFHSTKRNQRVLSWLSSGWPSPNPWQMCWIGF